MHEFNDIKNCPFCGGEAKLVPKSKTYFKGNQEYTCWIECKQCHCRSGRFLFIQYDSTHEARMKAVEAWNSRKENYE